MCKIFLHTLLLFFLSCKTDSKNILQAINFQNEKIEENVVRVQDFEIEALRFAKNKKLNTRYFIFIDMKIHPGKNRFYIWDFKEQKVIFSKLVTHGSCDILENNPDKFYEAKFSNDDGSHCSSIGKYKIGVKGVSTWGIGVKYTLHGLEKTNKNAEKRFVVLHSWEVIPEEECYPEPIALSWGCPAISNNAMQELTKFLEKQDKNLLLWIVK